MFDILLAVLDHIDTYAPEQEPQSGDDIAGETCRDALSGVREAGLHDGFCVQTAAWWYHTSIRAIFDA